MTYLDDIGLTRVVAGDPVATWNNRLLVNAGTLDARAPGLFMDNHQIPDGTDSGRLVYMDPNTSPQKLALAIYDPGSLNKARVIGITIEGTRAGVTKIRGVTYGRAPFNHGRLNYGTKLYLPHISDGEPGVLTTASTSGIVMARAARGDWIYFFPFFSASI